MHRPTAFTLMVWYRAWLCWPRRLNLSVPRPLDNSDIDRQVKRLVGIATLRRLRRMVDSEHAAETHAATQARRLAILLAVIAVIFIAGLALMMVRAH